MALMKKRLAGAACAALLGLCSVGAEAEVVVEDAGWQLAVDVRNPKSPYHDVAQWLFPPNPTVKVRSRISLRLKNLSPRAETAVLARYAFYARLKRVDDGGGTGTWVVPFIVEERHIPRIAGGASMMVPINVNRVAMSAYLKKAYRAGFWPDAFRVTVMVEPRAGESLEGRVMEKTLPVQWKAGEGGK